MHRACLCALTCAVAALLSACAVDSVVKPDSARQSMRVARADTLARLVAMGMRSEAVRLGVRDVLRTSRFVEHKVLFREFLATPQGRALVISAAREANRQPDSILALLDRLPELEFYMPGSEFRRAWRGESSIVVAAAFSDDRSRILGYRPDGTQEKLFTGRGYQRQMRPSTLYLSPAEEQFVRIDAPLTTLAMRVHSDGEAIEKAGEAGWGAAYHVWNGTSFTDIPLVRDAAGLIVAGDGGGCDTEVALNLCGDGSGGGTASPVAYLAFVNINEVCDYNDCAQNNEFEWHTYSWSTTAGWVGRRDIRVSLPSNGNFDFGNSLVANYYPPSVTGTKLQSDIVETDADWISSDDKFLPSPQWTATMNNRMIYAGPTHCYLSRYDPITGNCFDYKPAVGTIMRW